MSALLVAAILPPLWLWFRKLEREDRGADVVAFVLFALIAECCIYPNQNTVPPSIFHPSIGGFSFRLMDFVILVAVGARLTTKGLGAFRISGMLWAAFVAWLGVAAVIGLVGGNSTDKLTFEAKAIVYLLVIFLAAGVPVRSFLERARLARWLQIAAVIATLLLVTDVAGLRIDFGARAPNPEEVIPGEPVDPAGALGPDLATVFVALGVVALVLALYAPRTVDRVKFAVTAAPLLASPVGPQQRAAFVGLAVSVLLIVALVGFSGRRPRATPTEVGLALMAVAAFILVPTVVSTLRSEEPGTVPLESGLAYNFTSRGEELTTQDRLNQWRVARRLVAERPVFGWGLGKEYEYFEPGRKEFLLVDITHNIGWDLLLRAGIVGLGLFVAAVAATVARGFLAVLREHDEMIAGLGIGLIAAIGGLLAKGLVESIFEKYRLAILLALLLGMVLSVTGAREATTQPAEPERDTRLRPSPVPA